MLARHSRSLNAIRRRHSRSSKPLRTLSSRMQTTCRWSALLRSKIRICSPEFFSSNKRTRGRSRQLSRCSNNRKTLRDKTCPCKCKTTSRPQSKGKAKPSSCCSSRRYKPAQQLQIKKFDSKNRPPLANKEPPPRQLTSTRWANPQSKDQLPAACSIPTKSRPKCHQQQLPSQSSPTSSNES